MFEFRIGPKYIYTLNNDIYKVSGAIRTTRFCLSGIATSRKKFHSKTGARVDWVVDQTKQVAVIMQPTTI